MIANYIQEHIKDGRYLKDGGGFYENVNGWTDRTGVPHIIFSHRKTDYSHRAFYEHIHVHDFYEMLFHVSGDVEYISGGLVNKPYSGNIIINRPGEDHTTRLITEGIYERYVFYFDPAFLSFFETDLPAKNCFDKLNSFAFRASPKDEDRIRTLISEIEYSFENDDKLSPMIAYSKILLLFATICSSTDSAEIEDIPKSVLQIKSYIDANAPNITDVNTIAAEFFYSREHVSRAFKKYFNTNVSDYLAFRKAEAGRELLNMQKKVTDVAAECGFGSTPAFLRAFKKTYKCTPQEYLKEQKRRNSNDKL